VVAFELISFSFGFVFSDLLHWYRYDDHDFLQAIVIDAAVFEQTTPCTRESNDRYCGGDRIHDVVVKMLG
jgi:hypothetical protein